MKMLPTAHSYENTFNTKDLFFWGAGQKLQKSLTSKCLWVFVYDGSISSRKSKQQVLEPSVSRTSRYLEPNLVAIEFASLMLHTVISPLISRTRYVSKVPITRTSFGSRWTNWPPTTRTCENPNHLERMSTAFAPLRWLYVLFLKGLNITCA